jgi:hypothetical protein
MSAESVRILLLEPIGNYNAPNYFTGSIENLSFKYPKGT